MRVVGVGLVCVDFIRDCAEYPQEESDTRAVSAHTARGGNTANSLDIISQFSQDCFLGLSNAPNVQACFFGSLAADSQTDFLRDNLGKCNIDTSLCPVHPEARTPTSVIIRNTSNGSRTILHERNLPEVSVDEFRERIDLTKVSWVHFEGRPVDILLPLMMYVHEEKSKLSHKLTVSVEIEKKRKNMTMEDVIPFADVVFFGKDFATSRNFLNAKDCLEHFYSSAKESTKMICAWGEAGAACMSSEGYFHQPAFKPTKVVDTLGAGDTFNGAAIVAMAKGASLQDALTFACRVAGLKVGIDGFQIRDLYFKEYGAHQ
eukprot:m.118539 g.118539  ORF g.118539 m.118539 type:complete len:317 (+) comp23130_c0_seq3:52-1002(+)